jgi:hypothetical protein
MRVAIEHGRTRAEVIDSVDRSFNDVFQGVEGFPVRFVMKEKTWQGSTMSFVLTAKMGILSMPIRGTVEVTDAELIVDADLGMLSRFVSDKTAQQMLGARIKGLLK